MFGCGDPKCGRNTRADGVETRASYRKYKHGMLTTLAAPKGEDSLVRDEVGCISYSLYNHILHGELVFSPLPRDRHFERDGLVFLDVMGQPYGGEASPAEFVLDTIPGVEYFSYVKRAIQALKVPHARLSIRLHLAFVIRIDEVAKVAAVGVGREGRGRH
jgi:hypothetical protein